MEWPPVSVVFLAYNRRDALARSLAEVGRLDYPPERLETVVVDNASTDGTAEMVRGRFPGVRLIRNPENVGMSGWNIGVATAQGEWRFVLDDDCYLTGDAVKLAVRAAQDHDADLVSFRVVSGVEPDYAFNDEHRTGLLGFWGCAALLSRRAAEAEPLYDPAIFIWGNELDLTMRLLDKGFRHLYLPSVEAVHMKAPVTAFLEAATLANYRNWGYIAARHLRAADLAGAAVNLVAQIVLQAYSDDGRALRALPELARGLLAGLRRRRPVRSEVSRLYRRSCRAYVSPLPFVRSPLERMRAGGDPTRVDELRLARIERWYARRPALYPTSTAVLDL